MGTAYDRYWPGAELMNEVKRGSAPVMLFQKPANPLGDGVGDFLKLLLGDGKFSAERNRRALRMSEALNLNP
jgi:hypothetical protein